MIALRCRPLLHLNPGLLFSFIALVTAFSSPPGRLLRSIDESRAQAAWITSSRIEMLRTTRKRHLCLTAHQQSDGGLGEPILPPDTIDASETSRGSSSRTSLPNMTFLSRFGWAWRAVLEAAPQPGNFISNLSNQPKPMVDMSVRTMVRTAECSLASIRRPAMPMPVISVLSPWLAAGVALAGGGSVRFLNLTRAGGGIFNWTQAGQLGRATVEQWRTQRSMVGARRDKVVVRSMREFVRLREQGVQASQMDIRGRSQPWRQNEKGELLLEDWNGPGAAGSARAARGDGRAAQLDHPVLQVIWERARSGSKPGQRKDACKIALAIEGGGLRGSVTAGMASAITYLGLADTFDMVRHHPYYMLSLIHWGCKHL